MRPEDADLGYVWDMLDSAREAISFVGDVDFESYRRNHMLVRAVERHPFSNQTFVPLNGTRHLVAVCPSAVDGSPVVARLEVFVASGSQAVNYDANVWHAPRTALSSPGEFVMFRWDDGGTLDTETIPLWAPVAVELPER